MADIGYKVSVRSLCEFAAKRGDLDLRFTPATTAAEGVELHQLVARRRRAEHGDHYQAEIRLQGEFENLRVSGRADGWIVPTQTLEEVKSFRGRLDKMPDNHRQLHWAQLKIYGHLLCQQDQLETITLTLVYIDAADNSEHLLVEHWRAELLAAFWCDTCGAFLSWAKAELLLRQDRDNNLRALNFPFPDFQRGQRQLAENIYQAIKSERCLLAEAPTGIGKTLASLFPVLKAGEKLDKIFYLCAKTPGRALALDGLAQLKVPDLKVLELIARDKACEHPDLACHGDSCPLARGFYDRLADARAAAVALRWMSADTVKKVAAEHQICPYYLSQELCRWADLVVADYNYYFDDSALLYGLAVSLHWRVAVLVDEAHNLIERARAMYSARLARAQSKWALRVAPKALHAPIKVLEKRWQALLKGKALAQRFTFDQLPDNFLIALQNLITDCSRWQAEKGQPLEPALQELFFAAGQCLRIAELADDSYIFDGEKTGRGEAEIHLRNVVPGPWLAPRFEYSVATVLFSATLKPLDYQCQLLGLPADTVTLMVPSPFTASQLRVTICRDISTRYQHRETSLPLIVDKIFTQYQAEPGNYLVFLSSFDYLEKLATALQLAAPELTLWQQQRGMNETERQAFVENFQPQANGIGLAVLGGAFGEGIDLTGDRLVGAFIATLGLPQFNPVNEDVKQRLDACFGSGYDYVYLYPGLQKVVQAAGRIIRSTKDRGVLYLLDDRFSQRKVKALLPDWWQVN
ncbi:ATP-dependent DNA helicase [Simiduia curdlanivorans]|uniref:Helicase C-terminal domain-containing protein n=1 Tax=Simiduia curdlanivorans TaxID=1492769 RepID=A0ABV8V5V4_9GAMM|nr:ATP-dependent DNA helicase [Simiduia curdlanivorans]MDN3638629.1 ATP-dependent DNA helicase [Simiduia curdlanivorans]